MDKLRSDQHQAKIRKRVATGQVFCGILTCIFGICVVSIPNHVNHDETDEKKHWWAADTGVGVWIGLYVVLNGGVGIINSNFAHLGRSAMLMNYCALIFTTMSLFLSTLAAKESAICWLQENPDSCKFSQTILSPDYAKKQMFVNSCLVFLGVVSVALSIFNTVSLSKRYCHCLRNEEAERVDGLDASVAVISFKGVQKK